jgi:7-cyano-7-deazaguanine synthase
MSTIVVLSGGMDSTTVAHIVKDTYPGELICVSFDYGQKHKKELFYAEKTADKLDAEWIRVDLSQLASLFKTSALTNEKVNIPDGHYTDKSMGVTVVPNRNSIMFNIAIGIAVDRKASRVFVGTHAGDHPVYPDCRPKFIRQLNILAQVANKGFVDPGFSVIAPFIYDTKSDVVKAGTEYNVNFAENTWSCYKGEDVHCGLCATCVERRVAFLQANVIDETLYDCPINSRAFLEFIKPDMTDEIINSETGRYWALPQLYGEFVK